MNIKKLRKKIAQFTEYQIATTCGLYGEPFEVDYLGRSIMSDSPRNALHKYWRKYARLNKQNHPHLGCDEFTTVRWAKFRVLNKKTSWKDYYM